MHLFFSVFVAPCKDCLRWTGVRQALVLQLLPLLIEPSGVLRLVVHGRNEVRGWFRQIGRKAAVTTTGLPLSVLFLVNEPLVHRLGVHGVLLGVERLGPPVLRLLLQLLHLLVDLRPRLALVELIRVNASVLQLVDLLVPVSLRHSGEQVVEVLVSLGVRGYSHGRCSHSSLGSFLPFGGCLGLVLGYLVGGVFELDWDRGLPWFLVHILHFGGELVKVLIVIIQEIVDVVHADRGILFCHYRLFTNNFIVIKQVPVLVQETGEAITLVLLQGIVVASVSIFCVFIILSVMGWLGCI